MEEKPEHEPTSTLGALALALSKAQSEYSPLNKSKTAKIKTRTGGEYTYKYADLADLIEAIRTALAKNELAFTQLVQDSRLVTHLIHSSGAQLVSTTVLPAGLSPQEFGSALTYYRRYALGSMVGIAGEEDDDGAGGEAAHKDKASPPASSQGSRTEQARAQQSRTPPRDRQDPPEQAAQPPQKSYTERAKARAAAAAGPKTLGDWIALAGKNKGKKLSDIPKPEMQAFLDYVNKQDSVSADTALTRDKFQEFIMNQGGEGAPA